VTLVTAKMIKLAVMRSYACAREEWL